MKARGILSVAALGVLACTMLQCSWPELKLNSPQAALAPQCDPVDLGALTSSTDPQPQRRTMKLCVSAVERSWAPDWSRITLRDLQLQTQGDVHCVRVRTPEGSGLGYVESDDSPDRSTVELQPLGNSVEFLLDDDVGGAQGASAKLANALDNVDALAIDLFASECRDICRTSTPSVSLRLQRQVDTPVIVESGVGGEACPILSARAEKRDEEASTGGSGGRAVAAGTSGDAGSANAAGTGGAAGAASTAGGAGEGGAP